MPKKPAAAAAFPVTLEFLPPSPTGESVLIVKWPDLECWIEAVIRRVEWSATPGRRTRAKVRSRNAKK